ncbi:MULTISPECIES: hypothetical protein [Nocardia]|uniref:DUF5709 domain-containing protein n=1 Tax=Nocardia aurea TaxID=2144174 RepID=A0ABV3FW51_9NOCA|nr:MULTISPECIES: hypothetical protein [Nocardia]
MDREPLDMDMGDDEQADEIREYERNVENPPDDLRIRYRENEDDGRLGIGEELEQEWSHGDRAAEEAEQDDRPAEAAAIEIVNDTDL